LKPIFPEGLNFVKATHQSPYGLIKSDWKRENNQVIWDIEIPANTTASLEFPTGYKAVNQLSTKIVGSGRYRFTLIKR
jgi:alpha-L-rhamnosidase